MFLDILTSNMPIIVATFLLFVSFHLKAHTFRCEERPGVNGKIPLLSSNTTYWIDQLNIFRSFDLSTTRNGELLYHLAYREGEYWDSRVGRYFLQKDLALYNSVFSMIKGLSPDWTSPSLITQLLFSQDLFNGEILVRPILALGKESAGDLSFAFKLPYWKVDKTNHLPKNSVELLMGPRTVVYSAQYGAPFFMSVDIKSAYWHKSINCFKNGDTAAREVTLPSKQEVATVHLHDEFFLQLFHGLAILRGRQFSKKLSFENLKAISALIKKLDIHTPDPHKLIAERYFPPSHLLPQHLEEALNDFQVITSP